MNDRPPHEWERGFAGHETAQLRRMARLSLEEKLNWLEEAHRLAVQIALNRNAPDDVGSKTEDR
ncbi:MAG: hypothetical protein MUF51_09000 [Vicinamibacteria bacterium]|jgi:hypothetical protein|nr:hypothetical protein [Vicinamibacteria bacterium]